MSISKKVVAVLLVAGVAFSLWDYVQWHRAEFGRLGQGPIAGPTPTPQALARPWQSDWVGIRLAPPQGWSVQPGAGDSKAWSSLPLGQRVQVVQFSHPPAQLSLGAEKYVSDLTAAVAAEVATLPLLSGDRQYINTDQASLVVLTWQKETNTYQEAILVSKGKLVVMESQAATSVWPAYEPTFGQIYRSVVLF